MLLAMGHPTMHGSAVGTVALDRPFAPGFMAKSQKVVSVIQKSLGLEYIGETTYLSSILRSFSGSFLKLSSMNTNETIAVTISSSSPAAGA